MIKESCAACMCNEEVVMTVKTPFGWKPYCRPHGDHRIRIEEGNKLIREKE